MDLSYLLSLPFLNDKISIAVSLILFLLVLLYWSKLAQFRSNQQKEESVLQRNWGKTCHFTPAKTVAPSSLQELIAHVNFAFQNKMCMKAAG
jgi:hypothetical protein